MHNAAKNKNMCRAFTESCLGMSAGVVFREALTILRQSPRKLSGGIMVDSLVVLLKLENISHALVSFLQTTSTISRKTMQESEHASFIDP